MINQHHHSFTWWMMLVKYQFCFKFSGISSGLTATSYLYRALSDYIWLEFFSNQLYCPLCCVFAGVQPQHIYPMERDDTINNVLLTGIIDTIFKKGSAIQQAVFQPTRASLSVTLYANIPCTLASWMDVSTFPEVALKFPDMVKVS